MRKSIPEDTTKDTEMHFGSGEVMVTSLQSGEVNLEFHHITQGQ